MYSLYSENRLKIIITKPLIESLHYWLLESRYFITHYTHALQSQWLWGRGKQKYGWQKNQWQKSNPSLINITNIWGQKIVAGCDFLCLLSLSRVKFLLKESQEILSSSLRLPISFLSQILDTYTRTRPVLTKP